MENITLDNSLWDLFDALVVKEIRHSGITDFLNDLEDICYELSEAIAENGTEIEIESWRNAARRIADCAVQIRSDEDHESVIIPDPDEDIRAPLYFD